MADASSSGRLAARRSRRCSACSSSRSCCSTSRPATRCRRWSASAPTRRRSRGSARELQLDDPLPRAVRPLRRRRPRAATSDARTSPAARSRSDMRERFPKTLQLAGAAMLLAAIIGITIGVLSARKPGGLVDRLALGVAYLGISFPGVLGRAAADPALRGHAALAAAVGLRRAAVPRSSPRSRSACARSPSSRA